jgi:hypothetical protein
MPSLFSIFRFGIEEWGLGVQDALLPASVELEDRPIGPVGLDVDLVGFAGIEHFRPEREGETHDVDDSAALGVTAFEGFGRATKIGQKHLVLFRSFVDEFE